MTRPSDLTDEALVVALAIAEAIREHDGRLSARLNLAELQRESVRRSDLAEIEAMWAQPVAKR